MKRKRSKGIKGRQNSYPGTSKLNLSSSMMFADRFSSLNRDVDRERDRRAGTGTKLSPLSALANGIAKVCSCL